jgi:2-polyprenyl-3-methyl-5-hydroxy-6-metoxy-1,4-benzoquinol methylase
MSLNTDTMGACPVCSSPHVSRKLEVCDDRYGFPGTFTINECHACDHLFLNGKFSDEILKELYTKYYPRSTFKLEHYRPAKEVKDFRSWLNGERRSAYCWVPKNVRVLDIGCGFGETLGYHEARGCAVYGVEADENVQRVANKHGFKVHVGLFDPDVYETNYFDYVTMDQVIEHVTTPLATLKGVARVLKHGGFAIVSTPSAQGWGAKIFGRRWINWHAPYHLQFFSKKSMQYAAGQAGMTMERIETITSSEWLFYQWLHLVSYPCKGQPSGFWSPKGQATPFQKLGMRALLLLHRTKINHIITRVFDFFGIGDNYLFILRKP